ncbi:hypothetical protein ACE1TH_06810 [Shouchella sp. JSM 1781072]|uniref:hypothetical protein n=1 Tax=Bacillaceae TaxID=186817 RepID=UPI000C07944E|nr:MULTISPECIES: hypothetical protein [Bacillaceae]UTR08176.1 hypothetical protein MM326_09225 [Alkalihalobacillus sp. LMS6]
MHKLLAGFIFGISITGAVLIILIPQLFESPIDQSLKVVMAITVVAFALCSMSAFLIQRRLFGKSK